jgi:hypothetical protein
MVGGTMSSGNLNYFQPKSFFGLIVYTGNLERTIVLRGNYATRFHREVS